MKKRKNYLILGIILFLILAVVFGVSYFSDDNVLFNPLEPGCACRDSDGGANFLVYGEVRCGSEFYPDSCKAGSQGQGAIYQLSEQICFGKPSRRPAAVLKDCRDIDPGYCCEQGKCQACSCVNECNTIGERRCIENQPEGGNSLYQICGQYDNDPCLEWSPQQSCGENHYCQDGECIENITQETSCDTNFCFESDEGYNIYVKGRNIFTYLDQQGNCRVEDEAYEDYCQNDNTLIEFVGCPPEQHTVTCEYGCSHSGRMGKCNLAPGQECGNANGICDGNENCVNCPVDCDCNSYCKDYEDGTRPNNAGQIDSLLIPLLSEQPERTFLFHKKTQVYTISIDHFSQNSVAFLVNGQLTPEIPEGHIYRLSDGNYIARGKSHTGSVVWFYMRNSSFGTENIRTVDYCHDDGMVEELICSSQDSGRINSLSYLGLNCVTSCNSGECETCIDTDQGENPGTPAYVEASYVPIGIGEPERSFYFRNLTSSLGVHNIRIAGGNCERDCLDLEVYIDGVPWSPKVQCDYYLDDNIVIHFICGDYSFNSNVYIWASHVANIKKPLIIETHDFCLNDNTVGELTCLGDMNQPAENLNTTYWQFANKSIMACANGCSSGEGYCL
jgi:hypothetical protein